MLPEATKEDVDAVAAMSRIATRGRARSKCINMYLYLRAQSGEMAQQFSVGEILTEETDVMMAAQAARVNSRIRRPVEHGRCPVNLGAVGYEQKKPSVQAAGAEVDRPQLSIFNPCFRSSSFSCSARGQWELSAQTVVGAMADQSGYHLHFVSQQKQ